MLVKFRQYSKAITMLNLAVILEDSAKRYPAKAAFTFMDTTLS